jgi:hypothetical protein
MKGSHAEVSFGSSDGLATADELGSVIDGAALADGLPLGLGVGAASAHPDMMPMKSAVITNLFIAFLRCASCGVELDGINLNDQP